VDDVTSGTENVSLIHMCFTQCWGFSKSPQEDCQGNDQEIAVTWIDQSDLSTTSWFHEWERHVEHPDQVICQGFNQGFDQEPLPEAPVPQTS